MQQLKLNLVSLIKIQFLWWWILVNLPWYRGNSSSYISPLCCLPSKKELTLSCLLSSSVQPGSPTYSPSDWLLYLLGDWFTRIALGPSTTLYNTEIKKKLRIKKWSHLFRPNSKSLLSHSRVFFSRAKVICIHIYEYISMVAKIRTEMSALLTSSSTALSPLWCMPIT